MIEMASVPQRANFILNAVLLVLLLVFVRVWHLSVVRHDEKMTEALRPQIRTRIERAERGTIRDRFNIPLAVNRVQYNAAVSYGQIREVPRVAWRGGKRVYPRREHVEKLSSLLAKELDLDPQRVEDLIYSKAALFPGVPYVIKSDISEEEYYRLRMHEKDWLGIHAELVPRRFYPKGRVCADVLGYLGPISRSEYDQSAAELQNLSNYIEACDRGELIEPPEGVGSLPAARLRLIELKERAYSIHDQVGKAGVEGHFDEQLRGFCGKKVYQQDIYGSYIRELPGGREPVSGQRLLLTISSELQEYAEQLLVENETIREGRSHYYNRETGVYETLRQPWIKGAAIVAMDPNTGEVLAMASYPRFDPNDFIKKGRGERERQARLLRWFESPLHIAAIWDGKEPLRRERFDAASGEYYEEELPSTWENYLQAILPSTSPVRTKLAQIRTIEGALAHLRTPAGESYEEKLCFDLCRLLVDETRFSDKLLASIGSQTLSDYRAATTAYVCIKEMVKREAKALFHEVTFLPWRAVNEKSFLKAKRAEEKERGTYQRPYLDYLDKEEKEMFSAFWGEYGEHLILFFLTGEGLAEDLAPYTDHFSQYRSELSRGAHKNMDWYEAYSTLSEGVGDLSSQLVLEYLGTMRSFDELTEPLIGRYRYLRGQTQQALAMAFYPRYGFGYGRSFAFRQAATQGSVFKVVGSYAALVQSYWKNPAKLNPLTMVDDVHKSGGKWNIGFTVDGRPIPQRYKGGNLLKTHRRHVGRIDLQGALEVSSNSYFGMLAVDCLDSPEDYLAAAQALSFGARTGIDLPGEYPGHLPDDLLTNRTGLYCFTDGQHSLAVTPLQTAVMLGALANGGKVLAPHVLRYAAGREPVRGAERIFEASEYPFRDTLDLIGVSLPVFTRGQGQKPRVDVVPPRVQRKIFLPKAVRNMIFEGMRRVVHGSRGGARPSRMRAYADYPWIKEDYKDLAPYIIGKTGTGERVENVDLDPIKGTNTYNHIWFGGISFEEPVEGQNFSKPELVVVVYLRYGDWGKEAAPLAAQIVKKWRNIVSNH